MNTPLNSKTLKQHFAYSWWKYLLVALIAFGLVDLLYTMTATYMAASEGDVYLLPRDEFVTLAAQGSLLPLENDKELMALFDQAGINLQNGWRKDNETGESHLCGIPQNKVPGLSQYAYATDGYLCIPVTSANEENAMKFLRILCRDTLK